MNVTVIICTYNRADLLRSCLKSLENQTVANRGLFRVLVVDNYGLTECEKIASDFGADYYSEKTIGLSFARNAGWQRAKTPWVFYLDDDAKADPRLLELLLARIEGGINGAIGGRFTHWFPTQPPRWLRHYYTDDGYRPSPQKVAGLLPPGSYLVGGVLAVPVVALKEVGGFATNLGMSGNKIGWAEEDELQERLRASGYEVFYDPDMLIEHLVQPYKYTIGNQLKMAYANGRDRTSIITTANCRFCTLLQDILRITFINLPYEVAKLFFRKNYFWQNFLVSIGGKIAFTCGKFQNKHWQNA